MPLRDHFHPPLSNRFSWTGMHGLLPGTMTRYLNRVLPERYIAEPRTNLGSPIEVDIGAYEGDWTDGCSDPADSGGGTATKAVAAVWAPPAPTLVAPADWSAIDQYEVSVYDQARGRELVAAIEIISPSNKDRPATRRLFVNKYSALLQEGVSVIVIDFITERNANLYAELLDLMALNDQRVSTPPQGIYAVACRSRAAKQGQALETWYDPLSIGQELPKLPVWLNDRLAVPLELETIYEETLKDLRII